jgi:hypothetical protein
MFIKADAVKNSYSRLKSNNQSGKSYQEKTSCLMYFLAFDIFAKKQNINVIDLKPKSIERKQLALEYAKLVILGKDPTIGTQQIVELGLVERGNKDPEKRISSNFFTVPLKKASNVSEASDYPNRPAPILSLGNIRTGIKWGISYHKDWKTNLPKFLSDISGNTPFTDLAIVLSRNNQLPDNSADWQKSLINSINEIFSTALSSYWCDKLKDEKRFARHITNDCFFSKSLESINYSSGSTRRVILRTNNKDELIERVLYLEDILNQGNIPFNE